MSQISLAFVSDFCYPFLGGVEIHIMKLAQHLTQKVNKVIIITHQYPGHVGVKHLFNDRIKIYYLKLPFHQDLNIIYATYCFNFFKIKKILSSQQINLVHVHQSTSCMSLETTLYSGVIGLKVIHTEHSLFGFKDMFDIHMNKFLQIIQVLYSRVICVSRTTRNNFLLRAKIQCVNKIKVIPNAADIKSKQKQLKTYDPKQPINILFVGRLTKRRGVDLLIDVLKEFFKRDNCIRVKIIGDGVKMPILQKFIQQDGLSQVIQLLGSVQNQKVIQIMQTCHIYINTPLTQSFGIALIQAASQGLICVSTQVGGITEILPRSLLITTKPTKNQFILGLIQGVQRIRSGRHIQNNKQMKLIQNYNWGNISDRVFQVYKQVHHNERAISRKEVVHKIIKKQKILGYFMLLWFLVLCLVSDIHDKMKSKKIQKQL